MDPLKKLTTKDIDIGGSGGRGGSINPWKITPGQISLEKGKHYSEFHSMLICHGKGSQAGNLSLGKYHPSQNVSIVSAQFKI